MSLINCPKTLPGTKLPLKCMLEYRWVNAKSLLDHYCMKEVRQCIDEVGWHSSYIFTTVDLTAGFCQQWLEVHWDRYTAFLVSWKGEHYQWKVMQMGLQGSPAAILLAYALYWETWMVCWHMWMFWSKWVITNGNWKDILWRLRKYGLQLNFGKIIIRASEMQY